jgi:hypothetical protein
MLNKQLHAELMVALSAGDPAHTLADEVRRLKVAGKTKLELYVHFHELLKWAKVQATPTEQTAVREALELIVGREYSVKQR